MAQSEFTEGVTLIRPGWKSGWKMALRFNAFAKMCSTLTVHTQQRCRPVVDQQRNGVAPGIRLTEFRCGNCGQTPSPVPSDAVTILGRAPPSSLRSGPNPPARNRHRLDVNADGFSVPGAGPPPRSACAASIGPQRRRYRRSEYRFRLRPPAGCGQCCVDPWPMDCR